MRRGLVFLNLVIAAALPVGGVAHVHPWSRNQDPPAKPEQARPADKGEQKKRERAQSKELEASYKKLLEEDLAYIITREEKEAFLRLSSNEQREKFIEQFWEVRNPTPGAPSNPFKEEHYRRIEYANLHFGHEAGGDGWRSDRGRIYIVLGPPQQKATYYAYSDLRPFEIWFYSFGHPALPPFFYVVFYQRENIGDFRLYSPYFDGPQKLVTSQAAEDDRRAALGVVERSAGREVARISLSLIPDEPVDLQGATSSLQSDILISTIRNLANHPLSRDDLARRRVILESVTHRLIVEGEFLKVFTVPLRDTDGKIDLHYLLQLSRPATLTVAETKEGQYYYAIEITARVYSSEGKPIFQQERKLSRYLNQNELDQMKDKAFAFESRLPLAPGSYRLEFVWTDVIKANAFRVQKQVTVPDVPTTGVRVSELVPFSTAQALHPEQASHLPFAAAGVKFAPVLGNELTLVAGQDLNIFYQVWAPPADPRAYQGKSLSVEYAYGRPAARGDLKVLHDEVKKEQFDAAGSLVNGKRIPLADLPAGNYMLTVTVRDPDTQQRAFGTVNFRILPTAASPPLVNLYDESLGADARNGISDYERGLCLAATGQTAQAEEWFRKALEKDPANEDVRARLVSLYFARQDYAKVAELASFRALTEKTNGQTILLMAESLEKTGDITGAIALLESAVGIKKEDGPLHLALASYYQRAGNEAKASEHRRKGESLIRQPVPQF